MALSNLPIPQPNTAPSRGSNDLGEILIEVGVISQEQLHQAMAASGGSSRDLGKWLVDLGFTTEEKIMKGIGIKAKVPYFTSLDGLYTAESANIISEELARRLQVVPLFKIENVATVAMSNPLDVFTIDTLVKTTGYRIDPVVCMRTTIFDTINKLYGGLEGSQLSSLEAGNMPTVVPTDSSSLVIEYSPTSTDKSAKPTTPSTMSTAQPSGDSFAFDKLIQDIKGRMPEQKVSAVDQIKKDLQKAADDQPIVQLVDAIFKQAVSKKASDIHIEPYTDHTEVRFRIDGVLHPIMTVPKEFESALISRIKVMANLDITETRQPQDGRVMTEVVNRPVDLRISTLPIIHGEKVVIRILDKGATEFKLATLGFKSENEKIFVDALDKPNGIILVTGPTGSGKSTTLYTGLTILNSPDRNIVTLEDPVEYQLPRINQVQVNTKVGLTFAKGLRSILRQDPDVIMLGEIRDLETAEIAIQAALTGHLVLSTLHTNDAPSAITRLINMRVEPFLISASVLLIIAQRLVRRLCPECKVPFSPPEAVLEKMRHNIGELPAQLNFHKAVGCDRCNQTGYKGRVGVYEILHMTAHLRELAVTNNSVDSIRQAAKEQGMRTLFDEGAALAISGATTIEEMMRVCMSQD